MVVGVVVMVVVVPGGVLGGHDLREPRGRGTRGDVLRASNSGHARAGADGWEGDGGGGGRGAGVGWGGAAPGGGARAAPAALPPGDGPWGGRRTCRREDLDPRVRCTDGRAGRAAAAQGIGRSCDGQFVARSCDGHEGRV